MCLAIGPLCNAERSALGRGWWRIASRPHRLFLFAAIVHLLIFDALWWAQKLSFEQQAVVIALFLIYGIVGLSVLGWLLSRFPIWCHTSEVSYASYGVSYNLGFIGLLCMEIGWLTSVVWTIAGVLLIILAWLWSIRDLRWSYFWSTGEDSRRFVQIMIWLVYFNFVVFLSGLMFVIFEPELMSATMVLSVSLSAMGVLFLGSLYGNIKSQANIS